MKLNLSKYNKQIKILSVIPVLVGLLTLTEAFLPYKNIPTTGYFGPITEGVVKEYQALFAQYILEPWIDPVTGATLKPTGNIYKTTRSFGNASLGCSEGQVYIPGAGIEDHGLIEF